MESVGDDGRRNRQISAKRTARKNADHREWEDSPADSVNAHKKVATASTMLIARPSPFRALRSSARLAEQGAEKIDYQKQAGSCSAQPVADIEKHERRAGAARLPTKKTKNGAPGSRSNPISPGAASTVWGVWPVGSGPRYSKEQPDTHQNPKQESAQQTEVGRWIWPQNAGKMEPLEHPASRMLRVCQRQWSPGHVPHRQRRYQLRHAESGSAQKNA